MNLKIKIMSFLNKLVPKKNPLTIVNQEKELAVLKKQELQWIEENAQNIAENTSWENEEEIDPNTQPPVVKLKTGHQSKLNEIAAIYDKNLSECTSQYYNEREEDTENTGNDSSIDDLETEQKEVLQEAFDSHDEDVTDIKEEIKDLKTEISSNKTALRSQKKHNLKMRKIGTAIIIGLLALGEINLNQDAFSYAGFMDKAAFYIGIGIAIGTFVLGMIKASLIRNPNYKQQTKILGSLGILLIVIFCYYGLGTVRVASLSSQAENEGMFELSAFYFVAFNLIFYVAIFACKFFIYPNPQMIEDNNKYNNALNKLLENQKKLKSLKKKISTAYQEKDKKRKKVQKEYAKRIEAIKAKNEARRKAKKEALQKASLNFNTELALARNFYQQINADYKNCVATLFIKINLSKDVQTLMTKIDNLKNPFENIELIPAKKASSSKTTSNGITPEEKTAWENVSENNIPEANYSFINPEN